MRSVKIGDLKAKLSAHIQMVRDGEEVVVCDRNEPVARIVPIRAAEFSDQERRLIARGILTPPLRRRKASESMARASGRCPGRGYERDMASRTRRPLTRPSAFWDSSALVPLCARQPGTPQSKLWLRHLRDRCLVGNSGRNCECSGRLLRVRQLDSQQWSQSVKFARGLAGDLVGNRTQRSHSAQCDGTRQALRSTRRRFTANGGGVQWCEGVHLRDARF